MRNSIIVLLCIGLFCSAYASAQPEKNSAAATTTLRRDPFVPLIDAKGNIKDKKDLFPVRGESLPIAITLKGILWDERYPLAVINEKVLAEGDVLAGGVVLDTINEDGVVLDYQGEKFPIKLRKKGADDDKE